MAPRVYKLAEGSLHEKFQQSRAKIQMFGGGFGNGKTTAGVIKALHLARDYPGSNGLIARSTYPKLNDTVRKEFLAWCPPSWIKRKSLTDNVVELTNGSVINFRYIAQQGKAAESSTSNLLSATYDWILVDQVEDPEITHKDFLDLMGRLRGSAPYNGTDTSMPGSGPRWMVLLCNPTRNWVYRELVKPVHDLKNGIVNPNLLCEMEGKNPKLVNGKPVPIMELFEGSTYENKDNLPEDFIAGLEQTYKGQMRERFLMGQWGAYEGLVYPQYNQAIHVIPYEQMLRYFETLFASGFEPTIIEAYDHGIASPACYGFGFVDHDGNVCLMDGYYEKEKTIMQLSEGIKEVRKRYVKNSDDESGLQILADPAIFRRTSGNSKTVGTSVSGLFGDNGIKMIRGNNDILGGIAKVQSYLDIQNYALNPFTRQQGSPKLFTADSLDWFDREIVDYYWKKDTSGEYEDTPVDRNDHSMDMVKYLLSKRPKIASVIQQPRRSSPLYRRWREVNRSTDTRRSRHHA